MKSLTKLWQLTIGHEKEFADYVRVMCADYVRVMCADTCCNGDLIAKDLSNIIECFDKTPPTYDKYNYFLTDEYARAVLSYVFIWFEKYMNGIDADSRCAS